MNNKRTRQRAVQFVAIAIVIIFTVSIFTVLFR